MSGRRWTLHDQGFGWTVGSPVPHKPVAETVLVMPVSEHEALEAAVREALPEIERWDELIEGEFGTGEPDPRWVGRPNPLALLRAALSADD